MKRRVALVIGSLTALLLSVPWIIYFAGLSNIAGRPLPVQTAAVATSVAKLQRDLRVDGPIQVEVISPWSYVVGLMSENPISHAESGTRAAWLIARHYNADHLVNRKMIWWHISGAALTIWITRHWTSAQVVATAAAIANRTP